MFIYPSHYEPSNRRLEGRIYILISRYRLRYLVASMRYTQIPLSYEAINISSIAFERSHCPSKRSQRVTHMITYLTRYKRLHEQIRALNSIFSFQGT